MQKEGIHPVPRGFMCAHAGLPRLSLSLNKIYDAQSETEGTGDRDAQGE